MTERNGPYWTRRAALLGVGGLALTATTLNAARATSHLRSAAHARGLRFGAAAALPHFNDPVVGPLLAQECDVLTPENAMKTRRLYRNSGIADTTDADRFAERAAALGAKLRVHPLVFIKADRPLPDWLEDLADRSPALARREVLRHARVMAARYRSNTASIDVINEPYDSTSDRPNGLVRHWFYAQGVDHVLDVFEAVREAVGSDMELVINEWVLPYRDKMHKDRRHGILKLLEALREAEARRFGNLRLIDTFGLQSHLTHKQGRTFDEGVWSSFLREIEQLGYRIAITELSASDKGLRDDEMTAVAAHNDETARAVRAYLDVTLAARSVRDLLCWGLVHRTFYENWSPALNRRLAPGDAAYVRALPFDDEGDLTPMGTAIRAALAGAPERLPRRP